MIFDMMHVATLKRAGLSSPQAAVYLALLALGPSPVQVIARRAKVARGTTYLVLDWLGRHGLARIEMNGRRRLFVAESPEQLLAMIERRQGEMDGAFTVVRSLLPALRAMMRVDSQRLVARYYEGLPGLVAMRQEMVRYCASRDVWYNLAPVEDLERVFGKDTLVYPPRVKKGIVSRTVCLIRSPERRHELERQAPQQRVERKFVPLQASDPSCGLTIFLDRIAIGTFDETLGGMIIESRSLASLLKKFFDIVWQALPS